MHRLPARVSLAVITAPLALGLPAGRAAAQTPVHWSQPVTGNFTDPAAWGGVAPTDGGYDAFIDPTGATGPYYVRAMTVPVTTGQLTLADPKATLYVEDVTLNATRGLVVNAGVAQFFFYSGLQAPSVRVAAGAGLLFDSNYDVHVSIGTLNGVAQSRASLNIDRDLTFDAGTLSVQRNNVTMNNGVGLAGNGTLLFAGDGGYVHGAGDAAFTIGAGVTVTAAAGSSGRLVNVNNYGQLLLDATNKGSITVGGTNHGVLQVKGGTGVLGFAGVNDVDGQIRVEHDVPWTTYIPAPLALTGVDNRGAIFVRGTSVELRGTYHGSGSLRIEDGSLALYDTFATSVLDQVQRVNSKVLVRGTLDNTGAVLDVDAAGPVDLQDGSTLRGGRVSGTNGSRLSFSGPNNVTLEGVTLDIPVTLDQFNAGSLRARDGLTINRPFFTQDRNLVALNTQTYDGTGQVTISYTAVPWPSDTGLAQAPGAALTIGPSLTIRTANRGGYVGNLNASDAADFVSLINRGTIVVGAGSSLTMGGRNWKNLGTISIEAGGMLNLGGTFAYADLGDIRRNGQVVNFASTRVISGQTFDLNDSPVGPLDLGSSFFDGGRLVAPGRAVAVRMTDNGRDGLDVRGTTLALDLNVLDLANISSVGDLNLENATIRLQGGNSKVEASSGTAAIAGSGTIVFDAALAGAPGPQVIANRIRSGVTVKTGASGGNFFLWNAYNVVTNEGTLLATGTNRVMSSSNPMANAGLIEARDGGSIKFFAGGTNSATGRLHAGASGTVLISGRDYVNAGPIQIDPTGMLDVYSLLAGTGTIQNDGTIRINKGAQFYLETSVTGAGKVQQGGTLKPGGDTIVDVAVAGDLLVTSTSTLAFQVGGQGAGSGFDRLTVGGAATLDGTVRVDLDSAYKPAPGSAFEVLRFGSSGGRFASVTSTTSPAGLRWNVTYGPTSATLVAVALSAGDANLDGKIDVTDVAVLAGTWMGAGDWYKGDLSGDGVVDMADLQILRTSWTSTQASWDAALQQYGLPAVPVPEPGTLCALGLASAALLLRRRRSCRASPA